MRLQGQVAIVTGGSRGIGRGIVLAFAKEGAKVAIVYKGSQEAAESLVKEVEAAGGVAKAYQADVADVTSVPSRIRLVSRASPARVVQVSVGPGSPSPMKLSRWSLRK